MATKRAKAEMLKSLNFNRNSIVDDLTQFEEFTNSFDQKTGSNPVELQLRLESLTTSFINLNKIEDDIRSLNESEINVEDRKLLKNRYFSIITKANCILKLSHSSSIRSNNDTMSVSGSSNNLSQTADNITNNDHDIKVERIPVPIFSGQYDKWLSWKNKFSSLVDSKNYSKALKLTHLQSALRDEALRKIDDLDTTDENYDKAWQILKNAYENKKITKSNHLNKLFLLPKIDKPSIKSLHELADTANKCTEALANFGVNVPSDLIVCLIENKLDSNTLQLWEEQSSHDDFDSLDKLSKFLYRVAARMSCRDRKETQNKQGPPNKMQKESKPKSGHKVFITKERKCAFCSDSEHQIYQCPKFLESHINQRFKKVKELKLCYNCLKKHPGTCESKYKCKFCHKKHNSLLHRSQTNNLPAIEATPAGNSKEK